MKKRLLCIAVLVTILATIIAVPTQAAAKCSCDPDMLYCIAFDENDKFYEYTDAYHIIYDGIYWCTICFEYLDYHTTRGEHSFTGSNGGRCSVCGYTRQDKAAYEQQAWSVENDLDLRSGIAMYEGYVYSSADGSSKGFTLSMGNSYRIIAHKYTNGALWVQICKGIETSNPIGWVKAENLSVSTAKIDTSEFEWVIGRTCRVRGSHSKNLRAGPGDYPVIGTFMSNKNYKIYDARIGTDGKPWYKVSKDKNEWVSAAVVEVD